MADQLPRVIASWRSATWRDRNCRAVYVPIDDSQTGFFVQIELENYDAMGERFWGPLPEGRQADELRAVMEAIALGNFEMSGFEVARE